MVRKIQHGMTKTKQFEKTFDCMYEMNYILGISSIALAHEDHSLKTQLKYICFPT